MSIAGKSDMTERRNPWQIVPTDHITILISTQRKN